MPSWATDSHATQPSAGDFRRQEQLQELLVRTVESGDACGVQRDGEDDGVIGGARQWQRQGRKG